MWCISAFTLCALLPSFGSASAQNLEINSAEEFVNFTKQINDDNNTFEGQTVVLNTDIDLSSYTISPIGSTDYGFRGHFDGKGHTINGAVISSSQPSVGLFGHMDKTGSIRNLILGDTCSIESTFSGVNENCLLVASLGHSAQGKKNFTSRIA